MDLITNIKFVYNYNMHFFHWRQIILNGSSFGYI